MSDSLSYRDLTYEAQSAVYLVNLGTKTILDANKQACLMLGFTREEFLSMTLDDLNPISTPEDRVARTQGIKDHGFVIFQTEHRRKDGQPVPVEVTATMIEHNGETISIAFVRDASDKQGYIDEANEKSALFRGVFDASLDAFVIAEEGVIIEANPAAGDLFARPVEEVIGLSGLELIAPEYHELAYQRIMDNDPEPYECKIVRPDGSQRLVSVRGYPIVYNGRPARVTTARDISEQKRVLEGRIKADRLDSMSVFAGGVAHDFNNYLSSAIGNLRMIPEDSGGYIETDHILAARRVLEQAGLLTQKLLAFSKGSVVSTPLADVSAAIREACELSMAGSTGSLRMEIDPELRDIAIDEGQFKQVIHNLILNALEAIGPRGIIQISAHNTQGLPDPAGTVTIVVEDDGPGIPSKSENKIFDPYFTTKSSGTGLGLSVVRSIVEGSQGQVSVSSPPGEGTTFTLMFPAALSVSRKTDTANDYQPQTTQPIVLLLEDDDDLRSVTAALLEASGSSVTTASTGEEAVQKFQDHQEQDRKTFDVVLLDLTIKEGMDGVWAGKKIRQISESVTLVACSGYFESRDSEAELLSSGFDATLAKPFHLNDLPSQLSKLVAAKRATINTRTN